MSDLFPLTVFSCFVSVTHWQDALYKHSLKSLKLQDPITSSHLKHLPRVFAVTYNPKYNIWSGTPEKPLPGNNQKHLYIFPGHMDLILNGLCIKTSPSIHKEKVLTERQDFCFHFKRKMFPNCRANKKKMQFKNIR